jgi:hypothetical protein
MVDLTDCRVGFQASDVGMHKTLQKMLIRMEDTNFNDG